MSTFHLDLFTVNLFQLHNLMDSLVHFFQKLDKHFILICNSVGCNYLLVFRVGFGLDFGFLGLMGKGTIVTILSSQLRWDSDFPFFMASYGFYQVI